MRVPGPAPAAPVGRQQGDTMTDTTTVDKEILVADFARATEGALDPELVEAASERLRSLTTAHSAQGSVASMIFYLQVAVDIEGGKRFRGHAGGISTPGGGGAWGDVYTDDLDRLYSSTKSFQFNATPVYFNVNFFDKSSHLLGHFQAGAFSTALGTGGGTGSWS
ncbi:VapA/VapB family virulence-associated protein [Cellulosimicrobium composti]|uniref:VapA/VapB family virulence-associated protein n=2 Tax=Cellulosimicrobium composti TaxID=2672572 RepID=A0ABX0BKL6_9MICO|nr:VapA/VapB family virulence-associated protein [Cellulosimicrobium composti]NDO91435.1 VapA/VapB family virulence-associated protein [Cellulosimicrobium composti]